MYQVNVGIWNISGKGPLAYVRARGLLSSVFQGRMSSSGINWGGLIWNWLHNLRNWAFTDVRPGVGVESCWTFCWCWKLLDILLLLKKISGFGNLWWDVPRVCWSLWLLWGSLVKQWVCCVLRKRMWCRNLHLLSNWCRWSRINLWDLNWLLVYGCIVEYGIVLLLFVVHS